MNGFHAQSHRCLRHPHRPTVGVCASCVRDRLAGIEKIRMRDGYSPSLVESSSTAHGRRRSSRPAAVDNIGVAAEDKRKFAKSLPQALISDRSTSASPERNHRNISTPSPHSHHKNKSAPSRRSDASEFERVLKMETDMARKQSISLRSLFQNGEDGQDQRSKTKTEQSISLMRKIDGGGHCPTAGPGTKETLEFGGNQQLSSMVRSPRCKATGTKFFEATASLRQTYMADLKVATGSSGGEKAVKVDVDQNDGTSWISSLFHRKKSRSKSISINKNSTVQNVSNGIIESSRSSFDAGRLSSEGTRPNFRQLLKKQEAERKSVADRNALELDSANRYRNTTGEKEDAASLQMLRNGILNLSDRSSVSVEFSNDFHGGSAHLAPFVSGKISRSDSRAEGRYKDPATSSQNHQLQKQVIQASAGPSGEALEEGNQLSRSRSWGHSWSKTLSPLLGLKQWNRKGETKDEGHSSARHSNRTPEHNQKGAHRVSNRNKDSSAAFSFYLSPLRRSRRSGQGSIRLPQ